MKVKDIVLSVAQALGFKEGVSAYLQEGDKTYEREAELILACFNRVEGGLALEYVPLYAEDELLLSMDRVEYSSLSYSPVRIVGVEDGAGNPVKYKLFPKYIKAQSGKIKVIYTYTPNAKGMDDDSDFTARVTQTVFVHGILAEYCMAEGRFEEANYWDKKYKKGIETTFLGKPCVRLATRRWV